jgi:hypothetical protein
MAMEEVESAQSGQVIYKEPWRWAGATSEQPRKTENSKTQHLLLIKS